MFWSRGEGWVMGGLARTPRSSRPRTIRRVPSMRSNCRKMAAAVAKIQGPDGLWRAGLLDPADYDQPEISGSALMTFGMGLGVERGHPRPQDLRAGDREGMGRHAEARLRGRPALAASSRPVRSLPPSRPPPATPTASAASCWQEARSSGCLGRQSTASNSYRCIERLARTRFVRANLFCADR